MAPKYAFAVLGSLALLALGAPALANDYRAGELLTLDLSKAVLSPKRIGPPAEFAPVPVQARTDSQQVVAEPKAAGQRAVRAAHSSRQADVKPVSRSDPLDVLGMGPPRRSWVCNSGGI